MRSTRKITRIFIIISLFSFSHCSLIFGEPDETLLELLALLGDGNGSLVVGQSVDLDGNGTTDGTVLDRDGNGQPDSLDLDGDGEPDVWLIDENGDGVADAIDMDGDGNPDYYICLVGGVSVTTGMGCSGSEVDFLDGDSDGTIDGIDTDGDGSSNDTILSDIQSDVTAPTMGVSPSGGTYGAAQSVTLTCTDDVAPGLIIYTTDGSMPTTSNGTVNSPATVNLTVGGAGNGTYPLRAMCRDAAGNSSVVQTETFVIDDNVPAISGSAGSDYVSTGSGAINSTILAWQSDRDGSYSVRINSTNCTDGTTIDTGTATATVNVNTTVNASALSGEGSHTLRICVVDSGNGLTGFQTATIVRDDTAPSVTAAPGGGSYGSIPSVTLSCSDTGSAGCDKIAYATNEGSAPANPAINGSNGTVTSGSQYSTALSPSDNAVTYVRARARDNAGNVGTVTSETYTVDTALATITVNSHDSQVNGSGTAQIEWQSSRDGSYQIRIGGSDCSTGTALTNGGGNSNVTGSVTAGGPDTTSQISVSNLSEGSNTVRICVSNLLGNYGSTTRSVSKDATSPSVSLTSPSNAGPFPDGVNLTVSCSDTGTGATGCSKIAYTTDGSTPAFSGTAITTGTEYTGSVALPDGDYTVRVRAVDGVGNVSTLASQAVVVGKPDAPSSIEVSVDSGEVTLDWPDVSGATDYYVYYTTTSGQTSSGTKVQVGSATSSYTVTGLSNGTTYYFAVSTVEGSVEGNLSSEVSADVLDALTPSEDGLWCILQYPTTHNGALPVAVYGQFYVQFYTDQSGSNDTMPSHFKFQVGYGADGSDPRNSTWTWADGAPNPSYSGGGNDDEWFYTLDGLPSGTYSVLVRVSGDGGQSWLYCDSTGTGGVTDSPFSPADAGTFTIP
ncbi:MAG: chitobiase/beta-hexosaminidase C-terminal domain-containing protein [Leptospiraceae bacterium]